MVGDHIVDILDEYHIGIQVIEVLNERAVSARTEQDGAVIVTERTSVLSCGNGVGAGLLLRERDVICGAVAFGYGLGAGLSQFPEQVAVLGRYGEMQVHLTVHARCIQGSLDHMLLKRSARGGTVVVELEQSLGQ